MKTTIDIAEPLLVEAREVSRRDGVTLRSLVEEGLRGVLEKRTAERTEYLPKVVTYFGRFPGLRTKNPIVGTH